MSLVGARVLRKEDPNLLTGRGRFVDDIMLPGLLFMAFTAVGHRDRRRGRATTCSR
ncbi:hypothetical protein BH23ACT10_BH23ACT10_06420 [soil metagenome]